MAYQPIENYGIIGDLHSAALLGMDGYIDWLCLPRFDSPSSEDVTRKQLYWPDTNVLITRFFTPDGVGEITDYMPVDAPHQLIRRVAVVRGEMAFRMECFPAFNYARDDHETRIVPGGADFRSAQLGLRLATRLPLEQHLGGVVAEFTLREEQAAVFALREIGEDRGSSLSEWEENELFMRTVEYWRHWLSRGTYTGCWRKMVHRSALTLKLWTYEPTGAIVAAPTTSLQAVGFGVFIPVFFVTSGMQLDVGALLAGGAALALVPLFLFALLLSRGLPAVLYTPMVGERSALVAGLLQATSLPFIVAATGIGMDLGILSAGVGAAMVVAGLLSVVLFPLVALTILRDGEPTSADGLGPFDHAGHELETPRRT